MAHLAHFDSWIRDHASQRIRYCLAPLPTPTITRPVRAHVDVHIVRRHLRRRAPLYMLRNRGLDVVQILQRHVRDLQASAQLLEHGRRLALFRYLLRLRSRACPHPCPCPRVIDPCKVDQRTPFLGANREPE